MAVWADGQEVAGEGVVRGVILDAARGSQGFGYDPVFAPDWGGGRSDAEMDLGADARSHRALAFRDLASRLAAMPPAPEGPSRGSHFHNNSRMPASRSRG